jgi:hypothetical protein
VFFNVLVRSGGDATDGQLDKFGGSRRLAKNRGGSPATTNRMLHGFLSGS